MSATHYNVDKIYTKKLCSNYKTSKNTKIYIYKKLYEKIKNYRKYIIKNYYKEYNTPGKYKK